MGGSWGRVVVGEPILSNRPSRRDRARASLDLEQASRTLTRALVARFGLIDGRDAAADAIAWALEHRAQLEEMSNPLGYLYRVGCTSNRRERRWRQRRVELIVDPVAIDAVPFDRDLFAALSELTADQRLAVVMVHMYRFTYAEVADLTGATEAAVTNHVHRGLKRLRSILNTPRSRP